MTDKPPDNTAIIPANSRHERTGAPLVLLPGESLTSVDSVALWAERYQAVAVVGIRSEAVAKKIALHLSRFAEFYEAAYGHERITTCLQRDVVAWQQALGESGLAPATVNNHLASLSAFASWVDTHVPGLFPLGDPTKGISAMGLPPLEPRALTDAQVRSLKNVCDRLPRLYSKKGRRWTGRQSTPHAHRRPWRDRALVFLLLSTGLRRGEVVRVDLDHLTSRTRRGLRAARRAQITGVRGKGKTQRTVFLSADARSALADYLEKERPGDASAESSALFLSARGIPSRTSDGRLSGRSINRILEQIGRWHDADVTDPTRRLLPLRPHDLRHTFAFHLARTTGADPYELERRLGHRSQRYIQRYTNPPEDVAAEYVERF